MYALNAYHIIIGLIQMDACNHMELSASVLLLGTTNTVNGIQVLLL